MIGAKLGAWGRERYGLAPKKVDAFDFYAARLAFLAGEIAAAQGAAKARAFPSAFVVFRRRGAQVVAANALMSEDLSAWRCQAAPGPEEVLWPALRLRSWEVAARSAAMAAAFGLLAMFFLIPVAAVQGLLTLNSFVS